MCIQILTESQLSLSNVAKDINWLYNSSYVAEILSCTVSKLLCGIIQMFAFKRGGTSL